MRSPLDITENSHILCKGRYHCATDLLLDWFGFNQTCKSLSNSTQAKQTGQMGGQAYSETSPYEERTFRWQCALQKKLNDNVFCPSIWLLFRLRNAQELLFLAGRGGDQVRETASTDPPGPSSLHYIWYGLFIGSFKNLNKCLKILKIVKNLEQMSQITLFAKSYVISITKIFFRTTLSCNWSPWTSLRFDLLIGSPSLVLS